jgi:hypothetical protein
MASESTRNRRRIGLTALAAGLLVGSGSNAQEHLRARLAGEPSTARTTLADLPATASPEVVQAVVDLLQRPDASLRNEAMVWLMSHAEAAVAALAALETMRDQGEPEAARAAATVLVHVRKARPFDPTELRAELARADLRAAAVRKLQSAPEVGWQVLPELLAIQPLSTVAPALDALRQLDPGRLRAALLSALPRPGDSLGILDQLGTADWDPATIEALDRAIEHQDTRTRERTAQLLARLVRGGIAPPPRWLALLRSAGQPPARVQLLNELIGQPLPPSLRGELEALLAEPGLWAARTMLVELGADAATFAPALRRSLGNLTAVRRAALAECVGELAPATRDCAELLLPCLAEGDRTTILPVLIALVVLEDIGPAGIEAIAGCLDRGDGEVRLDAVAALAALQAKGAVDRIRAATARATADFVALAEFAIATLGPDPLSVDALLHELAGHDPHRRLIAAAALRNRAVPTVRLVRQLPAWNHSEPWATHVIERGVGSMLVRRITAEPLPEAAIEELTAWPNGSAQDRVRIQRSLAAAGAEGFAGLASRLVGSAVEQQIVLQALTQSGADATRVIPLAAAFVHHPEAALREAAVTCLRAVGGEHAITAARAGADPWARWQSIPPSAFASGNAAVIARDPTTPLWMRTAALRRIGRGSATDCPELFALVADQDDALAEAALRLFLFQHETAADAAVLPVFAGGSPAVRAGLGAALRAELELPWPRSTALQLLSRSDPANARNGLLLDRRGVEWLAADQLRRQQLRPPVAWSLRHLETRPQLALWLLHELPEPPEPELLPALTALAAVAAFAPHAEALLVRAGAPLPPLRPWHTPKVTTAPGVPRSSDGWRQQLLQLERLPWRQRPTELDAPREAAKALWQQLEGHERNSMLPLLQAMGPLAAFAADDLATQLEAEHTTQCASVLIAIGRIELVRQWLQGLPIEHIPRLDGHEGAALVESVWAPRLAAQFAESADADVLPRVQALLPYRHALSAQERDAVAIRLLAHAEAHPHGSALWQLRSLPPIGDHAGAQFAASYARRRAQPIRPDPFAEALAHLTMTAFPDLAAAAMRDGLVRCATVLEAVQIEGPNAAIQQHAATLVAAVASSRERCLTHVPREVRDGEVDPQLGALLGSMLHRAEAAPIEALQQLLDDPDTREFALAALTCLGSAAEPASAAVAAWLGAAAPEERLRLAHALVRLGRSGVQRLGTFVDQDPALLPAMLAAFSLGDEPVRTAAVRWLGSGGLQPSTAVRESLTAALSTSRNHEERAAILLTLLQQGHAPTQRDWLELANWRSAALRQRLVNDYAPHADGPIAWGVLAERLDDEDPGVRSAAVTALLAAPERIAACRRPLAEFAATAPPELASRIAAALAR